MTKSSKPKELKKIEEITKRLIKILRNDVEGADGIFIMLFNKKHDSHLAACDGMTGEMSIEAIGWILKSMGLDSLPFIQAILIQLCQDKAGGLRAGGMGVA